MIPGDFLRAARKYGPELDSVAQQYRDPLTGQRLSGTALLVKLSKGESGFDMGAVSNKGARGGTQFMPGTRQTVLDKTGGKVDPWRSVDEAIHGAVLHLTGKLGNAPGLEGYNPGDPSYTGYILGQRVGDVGGSGASRNFPGSAALSSTTTVPGSTQQIQLPSGGQVDLAGLLSRLGPAPHPQPMGIAPPSFAAGPKLAGQELQPVGQPQVQGVGDQLAALLAASGAPASTVTSTVPGRTVTTSSGSTPAKPGAGGLATFDGKRVSAWMVPVLRYARARGWKGTVTSGFRTAAEQDAAARNFGLQHYGPGGPQASNHRRTGYLQGAIDVTDPQTLDVILRRKHSRLQNAGPTDPVHFSVHRNGAY